MYNVINHIKQYILIYITTATIATLSTVNVIQQIKINELFTIAKEQQTMSLILFKLILINDKTDKQYESNDKQYKETFKLTL